MSAGPTAKRMAAPTPCTARAALRLSTSPASPQASEETEKTRKPTLKTLLRPSRSPREPPVRRNTARVRA
jgi:hypothetical protein